MGEQCELYLSSGSDKQPIRAIS